MMEVIGACSCLQNLGEHYGRRLIDGAIREVGYLCCFNTYATKFGVEQRKLIAEQKGLQKDVDDAREKNETRVEDVVELWNEQAAAVIAVDANQRQKWFFGLCPHCIWQCQRAKELEQKTQQVTDLLKAKSEFTRVARPPPKNPGIKFWARPSFIDFSSRKSTFLELVEALESENSNVIGLQGLEGMGKTTLATQAGVHVEQSGSFKEVIFITVSNTLDINKIRCDIAKQLNCPVKGEEEQHPKDLWARIAYSGGKVLIILDDVRSKIELKDIGIPRDHENCCVLITTHNLEVCKAMRCRPIISLNPLDGKDGLDLFTHHVGTRSGDSTSKYMDLAQKCVDDCGGAPLALVPMANMLKDQPQKDWKKVLSCMQNFDQPLDNDYNYRLKLRNSLMSTYEELPDKGKDLLLLCSLFPKDYEIPMEFLSKLGIGSVFFGEANNNSFSSLRGGLILAKDELKNFSLLLETKEGCVTIHDSIRKVVLSKNDKDMQVIMNSGGRLKSNLEFLSWSNNGFPDHFDGTNLEVLLLWIKGEVKVEDSCAIFQEMVYLKVLVLQYDKYAVKPTLSLQSFLSLKNIRTLILSDWTLGNISILKDLKTLVILEFESCLIMEFPIEVAEIESLRLLGIRRCGIERNNPVEVIERCSQLEELYFVGNDFMKEGKPESNGENIVEVSEDIPPRVLKMYSVACSGLQYFVDDDNGLLQCFNTEHVENLMSEEMFKYLVERAEILELCKIREARWKSLVPDIIPMRDGVMKDLIKLCLYNCADIQCLLDNRGSSGNEVVFSHLAELLLDNVDAEDLYWGPMPASFLSELKIFRLLHCKRLGNIFLKDNLKLQNLTVLQLDDCPEFTESIFLISVALSLTLLEELSIKDCEQVKTLIEYQSSGEEDADANSDGPVFPKLKSLKIQGCGNFQLVLSFLSAGDLPVLQELSIRSCEKLEYMFDEYQYDGLVLQTNIMLPSLTTMELEAVPNFINICKTFNKCKQKASPAQNDAHGCCCLPSEFGASVKRNETFHPAKWSSLEHINLRHCGELLRVPFPHSMVCLQGRQESITRTCPDWMVCVRGRHPNMETRVDSMKLLKDMQKLTRVGIRHSEMEEIFNVEGIESEEEVELKLRVLEIEGLHNLRRIYKDPNKILSLCNLKDLVFSGCDKLRAIFSTSTMKRLPRLSSLEVTRCGELVYIIEEIKESTAEVTRLPPSGVSREIDVYNHPMFQKICISQCNKLESLFSISTSRTLQKLESLEIEEASSLKEVFGCGQDTQGRRRLQDVIPGLSHFKLKNLPILERFFGGIDVQSVENFVIDFEVVNCGIWGKAKEPKTNEEIEEELPSTYSNTVQAMPHVPDVGTSTQFYSHLKGETKRKQEIETERQTSALTNLAENFEEVMRKTGEVTFSETSAMLPSSSDSALTRGSITEETIETQANGPTPALEKKASETSPAESEMTRTYPHSNGAIRNERVQEDLNSKDDGEETPLADIALRNLQTVTERIPEGSTIMKRKANPSFIYSQVGGSQAIQSTPSTKEAAKEIVELSSSTQIHSQLEGEAKRKQGIETQGLTSALPNLAESTQANDPSPALEKKASETSPAEPEMTRRSPQSNDAIQNGRVQEGLTSKDNGEANPLADRNSLATFVTPRQDLMKIEPRREKTTTLQQEMGEMINNTITESSMKRKVDPSSMQSQSNQSTVTSEETRYPSVEEGPKLEKATDASLCQGVAGPSSQISEIGEILEVMELKDGERSLLAKLLEFYPQLWLSRDGQRNCKIIAASYRLLFEILLILTTKTPCTITASDKKTLNENLDAATFYGFDKDWIGSVRAKVFDGLAGEEVDRPFLLLEQ